ncbi:MAG TPA: response regulator [Ktedonobacteraceae bacterium]|jgi:CheY-like chemotaxis protein|nr:response regulator [Ktedonobacteraceae bacterium]HLI70437.1 response regulator [Ktedonobacteraceae bacterium]
MARIGLLEDNSSIAKVCATMLGYAGHEVIVYANARECLQALGDSFREQQSLAKGCVGENVLPIDALILDLHLPRVSGLEVLRLLRTSPRTCTLPLIFCTAATPSEINLAFTIAPDATLIEKPFKLEALISAISDALPASLQPRR